MKNEVCICGHNQDEHSDVTPCPCLVADAKSGRECGCRGYLEYEE